MDAEAGKFVTRLRQALSGAAAAHPVEDWPGAGGAPLRLAAVLVPLVCHQDTPAGISVLLNRRTDHLYHHPGEICFPGGGAEAGDGSPEATALRETFEEIGLAAEAIEIIGRLPEYQTGAGYSVTPVVGLVKPNFNLVLDAFEVAEVFEVPLSHFLNPANHQKHSLRIRGRARQFHAMPYGEHFIWGATAGMLMSLYDLLRST